MLKRILNFFGFGQKAEEKEEWYVVDFEHERRLYAIADEYIELQWTADKRKATLFTKTDANGWVDMLNEQSGYARYNKQKLRGKF